MSGPGDVDLAVRAAAAAFGTWRNATPSDRASTPMLRNQVSKAALDAWYAPHRGPGGTRTPNVDTFTICPAPRRRIPGSRARRR